MTYRCIYFLFLLFACLFVGKITVIAQKNPLKTIIIDPGHGGRDGGAKGDVTREALVALKIGIKLQDILKRELPGSNVLITREIDELPGRLQNKDAALRWRANYANENGGDLFISIHLNASPANHQTASRVIGTREVTYYVYQGKGRKKKKIAKTKTVNITERYKLPAKVKGTQTYILARDWYQQKVRAAKDIVKSSSTTTTGVVDSTKGPDLFETDPVQARIMAQQYAKYYFQKSLTLATYCEEEFSQIGRYSWGVLQRDWDGIWVLQATQMPSILVETGFVDNPGEEEYLNSEKGSTEMAHAISNAIKRYRDVLIDPAGAVTSTEDGVIADKKSQEKPYIPSVLTQRSIETVQEIRTSAKEISVSFYDNAEVDGDTISVYVNNKAIVLQEGISTRPITIKIPFSEKEGALEMVMVAENLGLVSPNTALVLINTGKKQYKVNLSSSMEKNAAVKFVYDPSAE